MKEKWIQICQIQGYEEIKDCYWLSNSDEDKVMNRNIGKIRKIRFDKDSYPIVSLRTKNDKYRYLKATGEIPTVFNEKALLEDDFIFVTEGEIDALSIEELGYKVETGTHYNELYYSISWKETK